MNEPLNQSRRSFLGWVGASAALALAGCGGTSIYARLDPQRFLVVGDDFLDQGQTGSLPTVNDGTSTWLQQMAGYYKNVAPVTPASNGGLAWAQTYAMVQAQDTTSGMNSPSVVSQIDTLFATTAINDNDLVFINGGMNDIISAVNQTGISPETTAAVIAAADALAQQVRRLTSNGGLHVVVTGVYDVSISPWAHATGLKISDISALTVLFNDHLKTGIYDLGSYVLYLDAALFYNLVYNSFGNFGLSNNSQGVCTTPDAMTCTASTVSSTSYNTFMFADSVHFTPTVFLFFSATNYSNNAYSTLINRW